MAAAFFAAAECVAGCNDERVRGEHSASEPAGKAAATNDTVVRRVVRMSRAASAIQRVTPALHVDEALEPLDTQLVVRVLDSRGREVPGVPVHWSVAALGDGAQFRAVNERSDSDGTSRATLTPGATADTQHVYAEVAGVGRIDFAIAVPVAALRVRLSQPGMWSGDSIDVTADLRDAAGHALTGGQASWASSDTAVLRVRSVGGPRAQVIGVGAGDASVVAWVGAGKPQASARVMVRPVIAGQFVTLDGRAPPPMRAELRSEGVNERLDVVNGRFGARVPLEPGASAEIVAHALADSHAFHAVDVRVHSQRNLQDLRIVLVPTRWRIDAGTYAGQEVATDAAKALQRVGRGASFWRVVPLSGTAPRRILGWPESALPLHVAFDRSNSIETITAADSLAFWQAAGRMERDLGMRLFVPAEMRDSARLDVVPVRVAAQSSEGHTTLAWAQEGNAGDGVVLFRYAATLRDSHVVTHELLHLIGFGHTNAWPTVSLPTGGSEPGLTAQDVAYVQLAMRLRRVQHETGALPGLPVPAP